MTQQHTTSTATDATTPRRLRIGTLNVHGFRDAKGRWTFREISELLNLNQLDIIALQEARWKDVAELGRALGGMHWVASRSTALLSRFPLSTTDEYGLGVGNQNLSPPHFHVSKIKRSGCETRHARALVALPGGSALEVVSVHLDHVGEPRRLSQLQQLTQHVVSTPAASAEPGARRPRDDATGVSAPGANDPLGYAVWMGDFNALTRADYTHGEWQQVAAVRAKGDWEAPVSELTAAITGEAAHGGLGFEDARTAARQLAGPRSTCRYDTRIDYVFLGPRLARDWQVHECEHVEAIPFATDHNLVVATLVRE